MEDPYYRGRICCVNQMDKANRIRLFCVMGADRGKRGASQVYSPPAISKRIKMEKEGNRPVHKSILKWLKRKFLSIYSG
jgi:hypothetical protein